jgi:hypothetical protein
LQAFSYIASCKIIRITAGISLEFTVTKALEEILEIRNRREAIVHEKKTNLSAVILSGSVLRVNSLFAQGAQEVDSPDRATTATNATNYSGQPGPGLHKLTNAGAARYYS